MRRLVLPLLFPFLGFGQISNPSVQVTAPLTGNGSAASPLACPTCGSASTSQGTYASLPATCTTNDMYYATDAPYVFRCSAPNTFTTFVPGWGSVTVPPNSSWSWDNQASGTIDSTFGTQYMSVPRSAAVQITGRYRTAPATPYTLTALLRHDYSGMPPGIGTTATNAGIGLAFRDGTGKVSMLRVFRDASGEGMTFDKWTNSTSFSAAYGASTYQSVGGTTIDFAYRQWMWLQISDTGSNLISRWSIDGQHWKQFFSISRTDFFSSGPTQVGFYAYTNGCSVELDVVSWTIS